jgi:hypothetical protein
MVVRNQAFTFADALKESYDYTGILQFTFHLLVIDYEERFVFPSQNVKVSEELSIL